MQGNTTVGLTQQLRPTELSHHLYIFQTFHITPQQTSSAALSLDTQNLSPCPNITQHKSYLCRQAPLKEKVAHTTAPYLTTRITARRHAHNTIFITLFWRNTYSIHFEIHLNYVYKYILNYIEAQKPHAAPTNTQSSKYQLKDTIILLQHRGNLEDTSRLNLNAKCSAVLKNCHPKTLLKHFTARIVVNDHHHLQTDSMEWKFALVTSPHYG